MGEKPCDEWSGCTNAKGYGTTKQAGKRWLAHRLAWVVANGRPIPAGKVILHTCDNPPCCEPTHLRLGTQADNIADMVAKGRYVGNHLKDKTECLHGHAFDERNTYMRPDGRRGCRRCRLKSTMRSYWRKRALQIEEGK